MAYPQRAGIIEYMYKRIGGGRDVQEGYRSHGWGGDVGVGDVGRVRGFGGEFAAGDLEVPYYARLIMVKSNCVLFSRFSRCFPVPSLLGAIPVSFARLTSSQVRYCSSQCCQ